MLWGKETHRFRPRMSVERDVRNELRALLPQHDLRVSNSAASSIFFPLIVFFGYVSVCAGSS